MATDRRVAALPCVVCGRELENVFPDVENQAADGCYFRTLGQYGSTAFDPMNGALLEVNVCDPCLVAAAERGRVLLGRDSRPVLCKGCVVGFQTVRGRPLVPWRPGLEPTLSSADLDGLVVQPDEVGDRDRYPDVRWSIESWEP